MENVIIIAVIALIVFGIVFYLYRTKKNGAKCIGCPYCKECGGKRCNSDKEK